MSQAPKQYGLILKKKPPTTSNQLSFAFRDESDDEDGQSGVKPGTVKLSATQQRVKKHAQSQHEAALAEDPNIFDYDAAYEDMQTQKKQEEKANKLKDKDRKPKYMDKLIRSAHKRNLDYAAREERKQQTEREKEGDEFKDKEVFVTSAYRKQMEEVDKHRAEEAHRDMLDEQQSAFKQKDMSGFYKHFLNDVMTRTPAAAVKKEEPDADTETPSSTAQVKTEAAEPVEHKPDVSKLKLSLNKDKKAYRRRETAGSDSEASTESDAEKQTSDAEHSDAEDNEQSSKQQLVSPSAARETKMEQQRRRFFTPERSPEPEADENAKQKRDRDRRRSEDEEKRRDRHERHRHEDRRDRDRRRDHDRDRDRGRHGDRDRHNRDRDRDSRRDHRDKDRRKRSRSPRDKSDGDKKKSRRDGEKRKEERVKDPNSVEERMKRLRKVLRRRNGERQTDEYRKRYFERKADGLPEPPLVR